MAAALFAAAVLLINLPRATAAGSTGSNPSPTPASTMPSYNMPTTASSACTTVMGKSYAKVVAGDDVETNFKNDEFGTYGRWQSRVCCHPHPPRHTSIHTRPTP